MSSFSPRPPFQIPPWAYSWILPNGICRSQWVKDDIAYAADFDSDTNSYYLTEYEVGTEPVGGYWPKDGSYARKKVDVMIEMVIRGIQVSSSIGEIGNEYEIPVQCEIEAHFRGNTLFLITEYPCPYAVGDVLEVSIVNKGKNVF